MKKKCSCDKYSNVGMQGNLSINIPEMAINSAISGAEVITGFVLAEALSNAAKKAFPDKITTTGSALIKGAGAVVTGVTAFTDFGQPYKEHILNLSGGMAGNAIVTGVKSMLPPYLQGLLPSSSVAGMTMLNRSTMATRRVMPTQRSFRAA